MKVRGVCRVKREEMYHNKSELEVAEASTKTAAAAGVTVYGPGAAYLQLFFSLQVLLKKRLPYQLENSYYVMKTACTT